MIPVISALCHRVNDTVFEADFTSAALGAGDLFSYGLSYEKLSAQYSVQTGPSSVATGGTLNNSNVPAFGRRLDSDLIGLSFDESRQTVLSADSRNITGTGWSTPSGATSTANATAGPDGNVSASRAQTTSGTGGPFAAPTLSAADRTWSAWHKAGSVGALAQIASDNGTLTRYIAFAGTAPSVWTRSSVLVPNITSGNIFRIADGNDRTSNGGIGAGARDSYVDLLQAENGLFPTEVILTTGSTPTRAAPRLYKNAGSTVLASDGSLRFYVELVAKGAASEYSADLTLWYINSNNHCEIDYTTRAIKVTIGGTTYTTPVSMTWARYDRLRIWTAVGGSATTEIRYAANTNSPQTISTGSPTTFGTISISSTIDFMQANKTKTFSAWVQRLRTYKVGKKPSGF